MSNINDGGSAFPIPLDDRPGAYPAEPGMTLRDYFAAKLMPTVYSVAVAEAAQGSGLFSDDGWRMGLALDAYALADAMLQAREP